MDGDNSLVVLFFSPAILGAVALLGIVLLSLHARRREPGHRSAYYVGIAFLAVIALGIGTCYGVMFLGWRQ